MKCGIFFLFLFFSISFCDLPLVEKQSIDSLLQIYGLNLINGDYCGTPQYFECNGQNKSVIKISLIGDEINKTNFPIGVIQNFNSLFTLILSNTNFSDSLFREMTPILSQCKLYNCITPTFPNVKSLITTLYMNDVVFQGDINYSTISKIDSFTLTYSSKDLMTNYQLINDTILSISSPLFKIVLNNFIDFGRVYFQNFEVSLGKYFKSESFEKINTVRGSVSVTDLYYNQPIELLNVTLKGSTLIFKNIQFTIPDNNFLDFTYSSIPSVIFTDCSGLTDSNGDIQIIPGNVSLLGVVGSKLKKMPPYSFYEKMLGLDISNNDIIGQLPDLKEPKEKSEVKIINLSGNKLIGELTQNHCYHILNISNNQLTGKLPMCFICQLNDPYHRYRVNGNNFENYISGSENNFQSCTGISFNETIFIDLGLSRSIINGTNLGWQGTSYITSGPLTSYPNGLSILVEIPNKQLKVMDIKFILPLDKVIIKFNIPNINVTMYFNYYEPKVSNISAIPYYNLGYLFNIVGSGFPNSNETSSRSLVKFDDYFCESSLVYNTLVICVLYRPQMAEKNYILSITNEQTKKTGFYTYKFERTYPYISAINPPTKSGGIVTLFGSYGNNFTSVDVIIGKDNCEIKTINSTEITCYISGIDSTGPGPLNISLILNQVNWFAQNFFVYNEDNICPGVPKQCSGNGVCFGGFCACTNGFSGFKCDKILTGGIEIKKNDTLTEMIKNGYSFGFTIKDIKEIDFLGRVVRQYNFTKWELSSDSTIQKWTYINKFENSIISYTIEQITGAPKNFTFAGELFTLQPGSLKLSANISNWEYLGSLNTLQLQIESSVKAQEENDCEQKSEIQSTNNGVSLNYITIQKDKNIFSGRFIDKVVSDGRPTFSKVSISEQTQDSITVSLSLPYCKECLIDPDFSLMINPDPSYNSCNSDQESRLKWVIPVSVILGLLGLFGIFALVFFLARDRIYISKKGGIILLKKQKKSTPTINE